MSQPSDADRVRDYFSRSAVSFDSLYAEKEMSPFWRRVNRNFRRDIYERFLRTIEHVRSNHISSVLDVGCGSGRYAIALHENDVQRITGIDIAPDMIELFENQVAPLAGQGTTFEAICGDFMIYQPGEPFQLVVAMGFFDYIQSPDAVLAKMSSHATHSVIASFPSKSFFRTPIRQVRYAIKKCPVYFYDREQIAALGRAAGFTSQTIDKINGAGMDYVATFYK